MISRCLLQYLFVSLFYFESTVQAQHSKGTEDVSKKAGASGEISRYAIGIHGGLTQFYGELNSQDMKGMAGLYVSRSFNPKLALTLAYSAGKLGGEKVLFFNSYFVNEYNTVELLARWNITEQFRKESGDCDFSVYGGVGLMIFNANAFDLTTNNIVRYTNSKQSARNPLFLRWGKPKGPAGIRKTNEGILPLGMALDYALMEHWQVGLDFRFYFVRSDKVDATSGQSLENPEESTTYSDTPNDKFSLLTLSLTYRFGAKGWHKTN